MTSAASTHDEAAGGAVARAWKRAEVPAVAVVSALLAVLAVGAPGAFVLGSVWLIAAAVGRAAPSLRGPAAWAAAVVVEFGTLLALSAAVAIVSGHLHGRWVNWGTLLVPAVCAALALLVASRRDVTAAQAPRRWRLPAAIQMIALAAAVWVATRRPNNGIAWAMSGDARLHVGFLRDILATGGVTIDALMDVPVAVNAIAAILAGAGDRTGSVGEVIAQDAGALASTYVLAATAVAVLLAGALLESLPAASRTARRLTAPTVVLLLAAGALAGSPYVLGMALADGFVTTYGALPLALAGVVGGMHLARGAHQPFLLAVVAAATLLTFVSWTVLVIVPGAALVVAVVSEGRAVATERPAVSRARWWALAASIVSVLAVVVVVALFWAELSERLASLGGSARHPMVYMPLVLGLTAAAVWLGSDDRDLRRTMHVPLAVALLSLVTLAWLVLLPGLGVTWTYYALKVSWATSACLIWVPFVPLLRWAQMTPSPVPADSRRWATTSAAVGSSVALASLLGSATNAPEPLLNALRGWTQPSAGIVTEALESADDGEPFVFWEWSDPGNDRIGNFWSYLAWGTEPEFQDLPGLEGGFGQWGYLYTWQLSDLCQVTSAVPDIVVHTDDDQLDEEMATSCANPSVTIEKRD